MNARIVAVAAVIALGGCGATGTLTPVEQRVLLDEIDAARDAAAAGDDAGVRRALSVFRMEVQRLRRADEVGGPEAQRLLAVADEAERLVRQNPTPQPTPTSTPPADPQAPEPSKEEERQAEEAERAAEKAAEKAQKAREKHREGDE